jgi:hypothetical protein
VDTEGRGKFLLHRGSKPVTSRTDCAIAAGTKLCTARHHLLLTKLKNNLCTWWGKFSFEVFIMDWNFNGVKWETLPYLGSQ